MVKFRFEISLRNLIEQYNPLRDDNNLQVKTKKEVRVYLTELFYSTTSLSNQPLITSIA